MSSLTGGIFTFARFYVIAPAKYIFKVITDFEFSFVTGGRYFVRLHAIATRAPILAIYGRYMIAGSIHPCRVNAAATRAYYMMYGRVVNAGM